MALIGGATLVWPFAAQAQQRNGREPNGSRRLGVLMRGLANDPLVQAQAAAFVQGLVALNWKEGGNLRTDWRWAGSNAQLFKRYAAELVALGPDVLFAGNSTAVEALRLQTSSIPIVFTLVTDPVGQGFVGNLAHPGSNITGFSNFDPPMVGKWLGMLTQINPPVARVAVLYNSATAPFAGLMLRAIEKVASSLAVAVQAAPITDDTGIEATMAGLAREERGGSIVLPDPFTTAHRAAIIALAARYRVPAVYPYHYFTALGGLMSYGTLIDDLFRRPAAYVDRILKGAKPADLPVQAPTKFELVINLRTAKALGVTIAPSLLATADEVIE
jgi:ABC-type uncharacterized transport system substrate-binding protein